MLSDPEIRKVYEQEYYKTLRLYYTARPAFGSVYYGPRPVSSVDLALMRRLDPLHLDYPYAGSRMLRGLLLGEG